MDSNWIQSFPPILGEAPRILVLGSMPGKASLQAGRYYAHPRNVFWNIMCELLDEDLLANYHERVYLLQSNGIAVWDVCHRARRHTSLDSDISDEEPNDIPGLLKAHPTIKMVAFNGRKPASLHDKYFDRLQGKKYVTLLSTSPANAAYAYHNKLENWSNYLGLHKKQGPAISPGKNNSDI